MTMQATGSTELNGLSCSLSRATGWKTRHLINASIASRFPKGGTDALNKVQALGNSFCPIDSKMFGSVKQVKQLARFATK